ncbi:MAG: DUF1772 domain-containing protein [Saprospiraceae bacterium]|nr:DUF1772 domain-containing protein [Saprospiraceae bacterium]
MELSIKSVLYFSTIILTGLSAGFFVAWQVSVIPGTLKVTDSVYMSTMQSINRAILNPTFFTIFFGSNLLLALSSIYLFNGDRMAFWWMLFATVTYLLGTLGVTALGNVPLNDQLDLLNLAEMPDESLQEFRKYYEIKWNRLHLIRTIFSVLSFILALGSLLNIPR